MSDADSTASPTTYFGDDALPRALAWLREQGVSRPLVISGPSQRHVDAIEAGLEGMQVRRFTEAIVHVPRPVVDAAWQALRAHEADAIVTVGGGSATGLGKALRLRLEADQTLPFVAIPTTYAGSEMTRIYGITEPAAPSQSAPSQSTPTPPTKQTGRDERVRPDAVAYVPAFLDGLPPPLTVQSLLNAMAHPISALSTGELPPSVRDEAIEIASRLFRAAIVLAEQPGHGDARRQAARGTAEAARLLDRHPMGVHHRVAHVLGGRFGLPHAALHAALLPASLIALRTTDPATFRALIDALPEADPPAALVDALTLVDAPTSVHALEVSPADARAAIDEALGPQPWADAALLGRRPSVHVQWQPWAHGPPLSVLGSLSSATDVVVAVHGRGATADAIVQRARELLGDAPGYAVLAPQAPGRAWYEVSYRHAHTEAAEPLSQAIATVEAALAHARAQAPTARIHLLGFSQGACVAIEVAGRSRAVPLASVIALAGARIGPADAAPDFVDGLAGVPVLLGAAEHDRWLDLPDLHRTREAFEAIGADVTADLEPGDAHEITGRQRIAARALLLRRSAFDGGHGLGNVHASEALPGALPRTQNSPRRGPYGLYPEQWNGTGFVAPRHANQRTWVYRIRPSAGQPPFEPLPHPTFTEDFTERPPEASLVGYRPLPLPQTPTDFVDGLHTFGGQGRAALRRGCAIHLYAANRSMEHRAFYDADGDLLLIPEHGTLLLRTELGPLEVPPGHIAVVPRGIAFSVLLPDGPVRGYVGEIFGRHFELPERGVVGANGLADPRHFRVPAAWFEDRPDPGFRITAKHGGRLVQTTATHSPFDVVAWHGNYTPFAYDLSLFSPVSTVAFDHIDPSAYLVLTAPLDEAGADALDLVVFPPRWDATEHTFRPPFFHRNAITEFNGIVRETSTTGPFVPGTCFLTPSMTPHGVRDRAVERAIDRSDAEADRPQRTTDRSLWFQFETALQLSLSRWAAEGPQRDEGWPAVWGRYRSYYDPGLGSGPAAAPATPGRSLPSDDD